MPTRTVSVILFERFELLDVFGPVEVLAAGEGITVEMVGPVANEPVRSAQGTRVLADRGYADLTDSDILLVPGGMGSRTLVRDASFCSWLADTGRRAALVTSVCTGSAVLAAAGLLEGHQATSNKRAFAWASGFGDQVVWRGSARWVPDGDRWTASGVSAGTDMAVALLAALTTPEHAAAVARRIEYSPWPDPEHDPFAV